MSEYKHKNNNGSIFINDKKKPNSNDPDRKGKAVINGVEYWVSGWIKKPEGKDPYMSLSFSPVEDQANSGNRKSRRDERDDVF